MTAPRVAGDRVPPVGPVVLPPSSLLRWGAGAEDFSEIHHDDDAARERGLEGAVVHGPLQVAVLLEQLRRWLGADARVTHVDAIYLAPAPVGDALVFEGEVTEVSRGEAGDEVLGCELRSRRSDGRTTVRVLARVRTGGADPASALPLEQLRRALRVGEVAGTFEYQVQSNDLDHFARALEGEADPSGRVPATYFGALDPVERRDLQLDGFLLELPFPRTGGGNAFNEVEYVRPLQVGDEITVTTRYTEVYEKEGSRGTLLFRVRENEMRDASGTLVATSRCGHVLGFALPASTAPGVTRR
ncbi:MaoC family dehydratase N-terminal domain-containing protein [uncultured Serinicoccus sp.]|uniref:FAS1-like dehydratase domain-containing protein n=1 Tax=uncultured Serinicoccus sp. TaxID=735514 RepID=UPI00261BE5DA|nr:MaoC family dehydratase N-terminal domain-containing protein [uncultured Serinicoccus sp.]